MISKSNLNRRLSEFTYGRPKLDKKALSIKKSFDQVKKLLNGPRG